MSVKSKWNTPEELTPPIKTPVMVEVKTRLGGRIHTYGWFDANGWHILADLREYVVERWRYFNG